jgi:hypothetical protein
VARTITLQPSERVDNIVDGHAMTQLPYPFHVSEDGSVQRQDFWRGNPAAVVGFQRDLRRQRVDVWWDEVVEDPQRAVGLYVVTTTDGGQMGVHLVAIGSVHVKD